MALISSYLLANVTTLPPFKPPMKPPGRNATARERGGFGELEASGCSTADSVSKPSYSKFYPSFSAVRTVCLETNARRKKFRPSVLHEGLGLGRGQG